MVCYRAQGERHTPRAENGGKGLSACFESRGLSGWVCRVRAEKVLGKREAASRVRRRSLYLFLRSILRFLGRMPVGSDGAVNVPAAHPICLCATSRAGLVRVPATWGIVCAWNPRYIREVTSGASITPQRVESGGAGRESARRRGVHRRRIHGLCRRGRGGTPDHAVAFARDP